MIYTTMQIAADKGKWLGNMYVQKCGNFRHNFFGLT